MGLQVQPLPSPGGAASNDPDWSNELAEMLAAHPEITAKSRHEIFGFFTRMQRLHEWRLAATQQQHEAALSSTKERAVQVCSFPVTHPPCLRLSDGLDDTFFA